MEKETKFDNLPAKIKENAGFLLWRLEEVKGRTTKVPYNIKGYHADVTKRSSYSSFQKAMEAYGSGEYGGLNIFVERTFSAVDIDDCIQDGKLSDLAEDLIRRLDSYTEISPSGKGIRIIIDTSAVEFDKTRYYANNRNLGLEVYTEKKSMSVTGDVIRNKPVRVCGEEFIDLMEEYMRKPEKKAESSGAPVSLLSDKDAISKAMNASNGEKFRRLWDGDDSGYPSHSEAELALCSLLAFYCGGDMDQMDRIYRQSSLCGEKWDREDYRKRTLQKAVSGIREFYKPLETSSAEEDFGGIGKKLQDLDVVNNKRYSGNDLGFGRLFADIFKGIARFVPERKRWYVFNGRKWCADEAGLLVTELGKDLSDALLVYASTVKDGAKRKCVVEWCMKWVQRKFRDIYIKEAQSVYPLSMEAFDTRKDYFNCYNCTLDLATGEAHPHRAEDYITKMSETVYDPSASFPRWDRFIDEIMSGDREKARFLQKTRGYALSANRPFECAFFDYGETSRNGKGTLAESILRVMGDYGASVRPETLAQKNQVNSHAPTEDLARLKGIRYAVVPEPKKGMVLDAGLFKSMSGNDTLNVRFLNENSFEFRPEYALYVNMNHLPVINDMTVFESGRVVIIPFNRHFREEEQDRNLKSDFARPEVQSAILNWLLEGYRILREEGLEKPQSVKDAVEAYYYDSNKIARFVEDRLTKDFEGEERTSEVYEAYRDWCCENGCHVENCRNFLAEIRRTCEIVRRRPRGGGDKTTLLVGYRLDRSVFQ
jgi:putative DNA primase/helicase